MYMYTESLIDSGGPRFSKLLKTPAKNSSRGCLKVCGVKSTIFWWDSVNKSVKVNGRPVKRVGTKICVHKAKKNLQSVLKNHPKNENLRDFSS